MSGVRAARAARLACMKSPEFSGSPGWSALPACRMLAPGVQLDVRACCTLNPLIRIASSHPAHEEISGPLMRRGHPAHGRGRVRLMRAARGRGGAGWLHAAQRTARQAGGVGVRGVREGVGVRLPGSGPRPCGSPIPLRSAGQKPPSLIIPFRHGLLFTSSLFFFFLSAATERERAERKGSPRF